MARNVPEFSSNKSSKLALKTYKKTSFWIKNGAFTKIFNPKARIANTKSTKPARPFHCLSISEVRNDNKVNPNSGGHNRQVVAVLLPHDQKGGSILGKTVPSPAQPRSQKTRPNPRFQADAPAHLGHVSPHFLAQPGNFVDKADLEG